MTASRASGVTLPHRFRRAPVRLLVWLWPSVLALVLATSWHAPPVLGQEQDPVQPDLDQPPAVEAPIPLLPFDPSARQPEGAGPSADTPQVQGIEINPLSAVEPDGLGLLDDASGGLGEDLWAGSDRDRMVTLLALLPDRYRSAVLRDLARRLLLSRATGPAQAPAASGELPGSGEPDLGMLVLRVDRLAKVGDSKGLARLLEIVPRRYDEEPITRARVESALLLGDVAEGCAEVRKGLQLYYSVPYWQKALIACQLVAGETEQARLGLGLLQERGLDEDAPFLALTAALTGADAEIPPALAAQPLPFALLQARGQVAPPGTEEQAGLGVLVAMALSGKTGLEQRAAAAERATAAGALDPAEMGRIYDSFSFEIGMLDGAAAPDMTSPRGRALAYQRVLRGVGADARALALAATLEAAWASDEGDYYRPLALALQPVALRLPQLPRTLRQTGAIGRVLYAAGRYEAGAAWLEFAQQSAASRPEASGGANALWPYWRLAGGQAAVIGSGIASWQASQGHNEPVALARRVALLRAMLSALDGGLRQSELRGVPTPQQLAGPEPDGVLPSDLPAELASAAAAGRRGETVLLALAAMGGEPLELVEPATVGAVLAALNDVGLEQEARALAIETALAARI